jgi:tetratricopeptide (TPR) repeat protein
MSHRSRLLTCGLSIALAIGLPCIHYQEIVHAEAVTRQNLIWSDLLRQAQKLEGEDKYREAEAVFRQILSQPRPESMNDYMYYYIQVSFATILQSQGKFVEAIAVLQNIIDRTASIPESKATARRRLQLVIEHQNEAANNVAKGLQTIRQDANADWGYENLARGLAAQGQLAKGFDLLEAQLDHPLTAEIALKLAKAAKSPSIDGGIAGSGYRTRNSIRQDMISLYRQLAGKYPQDKTVRMEWLNVLYDYGQLEEAIAAYNTEIKLDPKNEILYLQLASKLVSNDRLNQAIAVYERILSNGLANPRTYAYLGDLRSKNRQPDLAIQTYLNGIRAYPQDSPSDRRCHVVKRTNYDRLVQSLARQNHLDRLLAIVENSIPNPSAEIYANLALTLGYENRSDIAELVIRRLKERFPEAKIRNRSSCS